MIILREDVRVIREADIYNLNKNTYGTQRRGLSCLPTNIPTLSLENDPDVMDKMCPVSVKKKKRKTD